MQAVRLIYSEANSVAYYLAKEVSSLNDGRFIHLQDLSSLEEKSLFFDQIGILNFCSH